ncbi:MAG: flagellar hook-associated protein 3 [Planctomycetes bacterium GWF2_41_51]|nr:MAG: flagellar hook-associated protein 3 [Planctomycetes bacterium GWF2_41_51]HBG26605.1 flagellar hook-associated protein 3 [Phycisphaerales bacterium]
MGGTLTSIYNNTSFSLYLNSKAMSKLQEQASTGSKINRASDNPSAAYQILGLNSQKRSLDNYMSTISDASGILEMSTTIIGSMSDEISAIKVSLNQILSGTYDEDGRERLANQVNDALEQMVSLANTKHSGKYIFGGTDTVNSPYEVERTGSDITSVTYQGSYEERYIEVAPGVTSNAYHVGDELFRTDNRGTPVFVGDTGAVGGTGTSSIKGNAWLEVTHDGTDYNLSIGGATVDLGTVADLSNVAVKNANGEVLYVDARNISSTGTEMVSVPGTYDIFNVLISVRDLLLNEQDLTTTQLNECRKKLSDSLDEVNSLLLSKETSIGSKIGFIEDLKNTLENIKFNTEDEATLLQEADIAEIAIDLARREALYQLTLSVAGRLMSMTLLDFIE